MSQKPALGRRFLAAAIDLYHFCYVALLPLVVIGAVVVFREERMIAREITRARAMPKGVWRDDQARLAELEKKRAAVFRGITSELHAELNRFLNSLAPRLDEDHRFKQVLDGLIKHPYTTLASDTVERGLSALQRHVKTKEGAAALARIEKFLTEEAVRRLFRHLRDELDYRVGQIADYLGFQGIGEKIRSFMRADPGAPGAPAAVSEALHWTNLVDKIIEEKVDILPETRRNFWLLKIAALAALGVAALYLALRDLVGRGASFGKRHAGLVIVDRATGAPAAARQLVLRGLVLVALLPLEVVLALFDARLGDKLAGTQIQAVAA